MKTVQKFLSKMSSHVYTYLYCVLFICTVDHGVATVYMYNICTYIHTSDLLLSCQADCFPIAVSVGAMWGVYGGWGGGGWVDHGWG